MCAGFGITFDGLGDYATLNKAPQYTNDGTFAIALWFTKPSCRDQTAYYHTLFSHRAVDPLTARVFIGVGCAHNGIDSTATTDDVIRVQLVDDMNQQANFDVPMETALDEGFLTSTWVHFVLNVGRDGVSAFVDGREVTRGFGFPAGRVGRWLNSDTRCTAYNVVNSTLNGDANNATTYVPALGCNLAYPNPRSFGPPSPSSGDNGNDGPSVPVNATRVPTKPTTMGFTMEDGAYTTGGGRNDLGHYDILVTLEAGTHHFHAIGTQGGGWSNGTYWQIGAPEGGSISSVAADGTTVTGAGGLNPFVAEPERGQPSCPGCLDSEDRISPFTLNCGTDQSGATITSCEVTVSIHVEAWGNAVQWEILDRSTTSWRTNVEAYGPIKSVVHLGGSGPGEGWVSSQDYTGSIASVSIYWSAIDADAVTCQYNKLSSSLAVCTEPEDMGWGAWYSTFNPRDLSGDGPLDMATDGNGQATPARCMDFCAGFQYFGLQWGRECYCGDEYGTFGQAESEDECNRPCAGDASTMCGGGWRNSIYEIVGPETGEDWSEWVPMPASGEIQCSPEALDVDAPRDGTRLDCHCSESGEGDDARYCAQEQGSSWRDRQAGGSTCTCPGSNAMVRIGAGPDMEYKGCFMDGGRDLEMMELSGDAHLDKDFGLTLDGANDFATITNPPGITDRSRFSIAFWMTKTACSIPGWWETVFAWYSDPNDTNPWRSSSAFITIQLGCADFARSTVSGAVARITIQDDEAQRFSYDVSLDGDSVPSGGAITDQWLHLALTVEPTSIRTYIDGRDVCGQWGGCSAIGFSTRFRGQEDVLAAQADSNSTCVCSGATATNGQGGPSCTSTTNGGSYCYTDNGACEDGLASRRVDGEYSNLACAAIIAARKSENPAFPDPTILSTPIAGLRLRPVNSTRRTPHSPITLGGPPGGSGGRSFSGSITGLALMRTVLSDTQIDCLYRSGEKDVHICPKASDMRGVHYSAEMVPATRMMTGAFASSSEDAESNPPGTVLDAMGTPDAASACATFCRSEGFVYMGLQWANECFCDNEYGKYGSLPTEACDADGDGAMDCGTWGGSIGWINQTIFGSRAPLSPCGWKGAVYSIGTESQAEPQIEAIGCFADGAVLPEGMRLEGDTYFDNGGRRGPWGPGMAGLGETPTTMDFGLHFDGADDYATISGVSSGYANDGEFAISLWATRPSCRMSGRPEILFSHTADPDARNASSVTMAYLCGNNGWGQHSTAQRFNTTGDGTYESTDVIRVSLTDTEGKRAVFDVPMRSAASGGYITDAWVHLMLAVERIPGNSWRDNSAHAVSFFVDGRKLRSWEFGYPVYVQHAVDGPSFRLANDTAANMKAECQASCGSTYMFFALEGSRYCRCGNNFPSDSYTPINSSYCDPDGDGTPNCGIGIPSRRTMDAEGNGCVASPTFTAMALFQRSYAANSEPGLYIGCYMDGGSWGQNMQSKERNAAYEENRRLRMQNVSIGTFNMDAKYTNDNDENGTDFFQAVDLNPNSTFAFHTMASRCWRGDCWNGGSWRILSPDREEVLASSADLENGISTTDTWTDFAVSGYSTVHVHINARRNADRIAWAIEDLEIAEVVASGPPASSIYLGGHAPRTRGRRAGSTSGNFVGNIADLVIFDRVPKPDDIDCMYRAQGSKLGSCRAPDEMWRTSFWESFVDDDVGAYSWGQRVGESGVMMMGAASIHDHMGLDLTANGVEQPMGNGSYYVMDGRGESSDATSQMATIDACAAQCAQDSYQYMGLGWGVNCYCDNRYDGLGEAPIELRDPSCWPRRSTDCTAEVAEGQTNETECSAAQCFWDAGNLNLTSEEQRGCDRSCMGDNTTMCGGGLRLSVYNADLSGEHGGYLGCYVDHVGGWAMLSEHDEYANDATFSVSFWFTKKRQCNNRDALGNWRPLFFHGGDWCDSTDTDVCTPSHVAIYLVCHGNSTLGDEDGSTMQLISVWVYDDDGNFFEISVPIEDAAEGGSLTDNWVHFAISVDHNRIVPYIDGTEATNVGNYHGWSADTETNLAYMNRSVSARPPWWSFRRGEEGIELAQPLGRLNFTMADGTASAIMLGASRSHHRTEFYDGYMAGVGVYSRPIDAAEAACLYKFGETHLAIPALGEPMLPSVDSSGR